MNASDIRMDLLYRRKLIKTSDQLNWQVNDSIHLRRNSRLLNENFFSRSRSLEMLHAFKNSNILNKDLEAFFRFALSKKLQSVQVSELDSVLLGGILEAAVVIHMISIAYHSMSPGSVKRFNRSIQSIQMYLSRILNPEGKLVGYRFETSRSQSQCFCSRDQLRFLSLKCFMTIFLIISWT
jgi:hypothetical protein